ncbi:MAG: GntR family transcriptional regulator [Pseudomonadota bacterium]
MTGSRDNEDTQATIIAHEVKQIILAGEFQPGDGLNEQALADRYGVSRTPIREALRMLAAEGVVEQRPRKRARVAQLPLGRILENLEALAEVEATCTRLSVRRMSPIERAGLAEIHQEFCQALRTDPDDTLKITNLNLQFHDHLVQGCHNAALIEVAKHLAMRVLFYRAQQAFLDGRMDQSAEEHQRILDAVQRDDEELAYTLMRSHFEIVGGNISSLAKGLPT